MDSLTDKIFTFQYTPIIKFELLILVSNFSHSVGNARTYLYQIRDKRDLIITKIDD